MPSSTSRFGFVTGCHAGDRFMVGATLASIRHYCPQIPICLIVDGEVDVSDLVERYELIVLRINDIEPAEIRSLLSGSGRAKLAAMWFGPFEHFVWMDSDAVLWGDISSVVRTDLDFQIFWSEVSIPPDAESVPSWLGHYYFDLEKLHMVDPDFEWKGHPYFSTGVFACKKGFVSYPEWKVIERWHAESGGTLFRFWEQGMLNYLVLSMMWKGVKSVAMTDLQFIPVHHGNSLLVSDCQRAGWRFPRDLKNPKVIHFCGRKPFAHDPSAYSRPFTIARLEHHRKTKSELGAWLALCAEEWAAIRNKMIRRIKRG